MMGAIITYKIFVNGIELARLKNGECKQISVVAGFHRVTFVVQGRTSPRFEVFLNPGDNVRLMFLVNQSLVEGLKAGLGLQNTYLRILWTDSEEGRRETVDRPPFPWKAVLLRCAFWILIPLGITLEVGYVLSSSELSDGASDPAMYHIGKLMGVVTGYIIAAGVLGTIWRASVTRK
jgi:hypothetical protein